jgi:hypothetical protein
MVTTRPERRKPRFDKRSKSSQDKSGSGPVAEQALAVVVGKQQQKQADDKLARKKRRVIRRRPDKKTQRRYFTEVTQAAIVQWQMTEVSSEKESLYVEHISPAFNELVENLINVYGFKVLHDSRQDLKNECLEFLYTVLHKFDHTRGFKAFSYFNVVAKRWLTIRSMQNVKRMKQHVSMDDTMYELSQADWETIETHVFVPSHDDVVTAADFRTMIYKLLDHIDERLKTDNEKQVLCAIRVVLDQLDDIDIVNKRGMLLYIREITGLNSKQLSVVLSSIKKHYRELRKLEEFSY